MNHTPAEISRQLLVDLSLGTLPSEEASWPIHVHTEPATPDNCMTVYDTTGSDDGREMVSGEMQGHFGIQLRVRAESAQLAWAKAFAATEVMAENVLRSQVSVTEDSVTETYIVQCFARISDPISLGRDPSSSRYLVTVNAVVSLRQLS